jgi:hypothetical protein
MGNFAERWPRCAIEFRAVSLGAGEFPFQSSSHVRQLGDTRTDPHNHGLISYQQRGIS